MALSPLERATLDRILRTNGYHAERAVEGDMAAADSPLAPGRCSLFYEDEARTRVIAATSLPEIAAALAGEGFVPADAAPLPAGAVAAFRAGDVGQAHALVRRMFMLSKDLPLTPLDRFRAQTRGMPATTEAERLAVQRIGQDIFRGRLEAMWDRRCAVTGLDQPELLRASHIRPWAECASDAERLDPHNGLLLAVHWDAAFDRGLVSFNDEGGVLAAPALTPATRALLGLDPPPGTPPPHLPLQPQHQPYLAWHRTRSFRG